jgi:hypothetical protein
MPQYGDKLCIDFDFTVIPELQEEMEKVVGQMSQAWWLTPNEKRAAMSYGMDEDNPQLDDYYVPSNLIPISGDSMEMPIEQLNEDVSPVLVKRQVSGMNDMFTTIEEAKERCIQMGGDGSYHSHQFNGNTVFMPFETHEEYEAAKNGKLDEYQNGKEQESLTKGESFNDYPQGATNNAKRMIEWREKYGRDVVKGGTAVGWNKAAKLAKRESLSLDTVKRVHSFLSRHEENAKIADEYRDEPWKDKGYVAYNLWGGKAMVSWAKRISENDNKKG